jgi:hypothetical protein
MGSPDPIFIDCVQAVLEGILMSFDRAALVTKEVRDGLQCWLDAIEAGTQRGTPEEAEELRSRIADHDADLAKHGYS